MRPLEIFGSGLPAWEANGGPWLQLLGCGGLAQLPERVAGANNRFGELDGQGCAHSRRPQHVAVEALQVTQWLRRRLWQVLAVEQVCVSARPEGAVTDMLAQSLRSWCHAPFIGLAMWFPESRFKALARAQRNGIKVAVRGGSRSRFGDVIGLIKRRRPGT